MRFNKLNDWVKALVINFIGSILTIIFWNIHSFPEGLWVMIVFTVIVIAYYSFAGVLLKNSKTYIVAIIFIGLFIISGFISGDFSLVLSGGGIVFMQIFSYIDENPQHYVISAGLTGMFVPFIITYISMKIARYREEKLRPYLEEIMAKNDAENC